MYVSIQYTHIPSHAHTYIHPKCIHPTSYLVSSISFKSCYTLVFHASFLQLSGDKSIMCSFRQLNNKEKSMSGMMQYIMYRDYGVFSFSQKGIVSYILCAGDNIIFIVEFILSYFIPFLDCKHLLKHCFTNASQFFWNLSDFKEMLLMLFQFILN